MFDTVSSFEATGDSDPLTSPKGRQSNPSDRDLQRAQGWGRIVVTGSEKGARIVEVFQRSPIRILFPRVGGAAVEEAVLINTTGGGSGGDWLPGGRSGLAKACIPMYTAAPRK